MRLLIISNMSHYQRDGQIVGWGPTVEEISHLSTLFDSVRHLGCLHETAAPDSALPYSAQNVTLVPLPPAGGSTLRDKWAIVKLIPMYLHEIITELRECDVVHVRCPANIPLLALLVLIFVNNPTTRWVKYAGNWGAGKAYPRFFRFQRWLLRSGICRCEVTVNGEWLNQGKHIHSFFNPCLTSSEIENASSSAEHKTLSTPIRSIFVGALNPRKGIDRLLEIARQLKQGDTPFILDILGDGPDRMKYEKKSAALGLSEQVFFRGWKPKDKLSPYYKNAHLNILPSESEGWPKVLSEGMAYGVVPLAGAVASIPQILDETGAGIAVYPYDNIQGYVDQIKKLYVCPELWKEYSQNAQKSVSIFSYEKYLESVKVLFFDSWGINI